jgi:hypothetical protein
MNKIHFVPECFAETVIVDLLFLKKEHNDILNHEQGIGAVSSVLKRKDKKGYINIGFVDDDKLKPSYLKEFELNDELNHISFLHKPQSNDYLFVAKPAIEKFILNEIDELSMAPSQFELPDDLKSFKKLFKNSLIGEDDNYKKLINYLFSNGSSGIKFIQNRIESLRKI